MYSSTMHAYVLEYNAYFCPMPITSDAFVWHRRAIVQRAQAMLPKPLRCYLRGVSGNHRIGACPADDGTNPLARPQGDPPLAQSGDGCGATQIRGEPHFEP